MAAAAHRHTTMSAPSRKDSTGHSGRPRRRSNAVNNFGPMPTASAINRSSRVASRTEKNEGASTSIRVDREASHSINHAIDVRTTGVTRVKAERTRMSRTEIGPDTSRRIRHATTPTNSIAGTAGITPSVTPLTITGDMFSTIHAEATEAGNGVSPTSVIVTKRIARVMMASTATPSVAADKSPKRRSRAFRSERGEGAAAAALRGVFAFGCDCPASRVACAAAGRPLRPESVRWR